MEEVHGRLTAAQSGGNLDTELARTLPSEKGKLPLHQSQ